MSGELFRRVGEGERQVKICTISNLEPGYMMVPFSETEFIRMEFGGRGESWLQTDLGSTNTQGGE